MFRFQEAGSGNNECCVCFFFPLKYKSGVLVTPPS